MIDTTNGDPTTRWAIRHPPSYANNPPKVLLLNPVLDGEAYDLLFSMSVILLVDRLPGNYDGTAAGMAGHPDSPPDWQQVPYLGHTRVVLRKRGDYTSYTFQDFVQDINVSSQVLRESEMSAVSIDSKNHNNIEWIQYLRGLAALAVVLDHTAAMASFDKYFGQEVLDGFLYKGAIGVDLFFVISGFIISIVSLKPDLKPSTTLSDFFQKRFLRIVPLMWVAVIAYAMLRLVGRSADQFDPWTYIRYKSFAPMARRIGPQGDLDAAA